MMASIQKTLGSFRLIAKTALTGLTGPEVDVEVWNGRLLFQDRVKLGRDSERTRLAKRVVAQCKEELDQAQVETALLEILQELNELPEERPESEPQPARPTHEYRSTDEGLFRGDTQLTNFPARIATEITCDDGATESKFFEIEATFGEVTKRVVVSAESFSGMNWHLPLLGPEANVYPYQNQHARAAIQELSAGIKRRRVYTHTGWRKIEGEWFYLHASGAIGKDGFTDKFEIDLGQDRLNSYSLPVPPTGERLQEAIRASLGLITAAPLTITVPLFATAYRAPLSEVLPAEFSIHLEGLTGTQKTELTALVQSHFGKTFSGSNLPGNWSSTASSLEGKAFIAKDAVFSVDDFKPKGFNREIEELHSTADRLLRGQANQGGRSRSKSDGTLEKHEFYSRGLIVSSGEDTPKGESLNARMFVLSIAKGDVYLDRLTELQKASREGLLAGAMAGYVQYLAGRLDELRDKLPSALEQRRDQFRQLPQLRGHDRTPDNLASLESGLLVFLGFAEKANAITSEQRQRLWERGTAAMMGAVIQQTSTDVREDEVEEYLRFLRIAIETGDAHLANASDDQAPENCEHFGWKRFGENTSRQGSCVGWLDGEDLYLNPDNAYAAAKKAAYKQGGSVPLRETTLRKRLQEKGLLESNDPGHMTTRKTINGTPKRVLHLKLTTLLPDSGQSGQTGQEGCEPKC